MLRTGKNAIKFEKLFIAAKIDRFPLLVRTGVPYRQIPAPWDKIVSQCVNPFWYSALALPTDTVHIGERLGKHHPQILANRNNAQTCRL